MKSYLFSKIMSFCRFKHPVRILIKTGYSDVWREDESINGICWLYWCGDKNFPIKLMPDGTGVMMLEGRAGTGKTWPGFKWKYAE